MLYILLYICATGDDSVADSDDLQRVISAIGEASLTETLALQEAIMQSQMPTTAASGIHDFLFILSLVVCLFVCLLLTR